MTKLKVHFDDINHGIALGIRCKNYILAGWLSVGPPIWWKPVLNWIWKKEFKEFSVGWLFVCFRWQIMKI